jgi:predicted DNA-binding transcriptional regulator AlpA
VTTLEVLAELDRAIGHARPEDLPGLVGRLAQAQAVALARLTTPALNQNRPEDVDENLSATEAGERLGMSKEWVYRHADSLPFTVRIGRRVLFSARGLARWNRQRMDQ